MTPLPQLIHYMHLYYFPRGSEHQVFVAMSEVPYYLRNTLIADKLVKL